MRTNFPTILIAFDNNMQISEAFKHCFSPSIGDICSPAEFFLNIFKDFFIEIELLSIEELLIQSRILDCSRGPS